jgi:multicomponent Na+:H+ antiporter subunit C
VTLLFSATVGILFASGTYLVLKPDLFRVIAGMLLVSNASILTLMAAGLGRGQAPTRPLEPGQAVSDPLVQALTLTAIVIGFAVSALLLVLAYRVYITHASVDLDDLSREEARTERELEREEVSV